MSGLRCDGQGTALENMPEPGDRRAGHMYALDESTTPSTHVIVSGKGEVALQTFDMKELLEYWKGLEAEIDPQLVVEPNRRAMLVLTHWHVDEGTDWYEATDYAQRLIERLRIHRLVIQETP